MKESKNAKLKNVDLENQIINFFYKVKKPFPVLIPS